MAAITSAALVAGGTAFAANKQAKAAEKAGRRAADAASFKPFNTTGAFGSTSITPGSRGQPGSVSIGTNPQIEMFQQLAQQLGGQFQGAPGLAFGPGQQPDVDLQGLFGQVQDAAGPIEGFDAGQFTQTQFDRLQGLAERGEETAAARTANQLFSRGRLGAQDTAAGGVFGRLAEAQENARTQRGLQAIGLAGQEQQRLQQARQSDVQTALQGFGAGGQLFGLLRGDQFQRAGFQNQAVQQLFSQLQGATQGINTASQPLFQQLNAALAAGGAATQAGGTAGALQMQGANRAGDIRGEFFGSLLGAGSQLFSGANFGGNPTNISQIDTSNFPGRVTGSIGGG
jgi:hypothetical protein